ncbi:MAG: CDP-archaeol synthase [Christensenellaceae bacterium]|nr:CDP-archaeol synthase [Christensenellaceae bacterium]
MSETSKLNKKQKRFFTAVVLMLAVILLLVVRGWLFGIVAWVCFAITIYEEFRALKQGGHNPVTFPTWIAFFSFLPLQLIFSELMLIVPTISIFLISIVIAIVARKEPSLIDVMVSALPMISIAIPGMCFISLLNVTPEALQIALLMMVFTISIGTDTFAYEIGIHFGKTPLCPIVSPNKTVEGSIGGLLGGLLFTVIAGEIIKLISGSTILPSIWALIIIGLLGSVVAQIGDLFASLVKRHCNIKDFGTLFPGHGGMLDRTDSVLFVSVFVYCIKVVFY